MTKRGKSQGYVLRECTLSSGSNDTPAQCTTDTSSWLAFCWFSTPYGNSAALVVSSAINSPSTKRSSFFCASLRICAKHFNAGYSLLESSFTCTTALTRSVQYATASSSAVCNFLCLLLLCLLLSIVAVSGSCAA